MDNKGKVPASEQTKVIPICFPCVWSLTSGRMGADEGFFFFFFTTSYTKCNMAFAHSRITDFFFFNFNTAVQILMGLLTNEENNLSCSYCPESMTITRHHRNIQTDPRDVLQNTTTLFLAFLLVSGPEKERLNRLKFWFYISWWNTCYLHVTSNSIDLRIEGFRSQPFYWDATL